MRAKLFILALIVIVALANSQGWREALSPTYPPGTVFYKTFMVNKNIAFVVGNNGIILKSTDSGLNWTRLNSGVTRTLYSIYFLNEQIGFVGGSSRTLLKTKNGGTTWDSINVTKIPNSTATIYALYFADTTTGWMMASTSSQGWILRTTDGGNTWTIDTTISKQLYNMYFYAPGKGIVVGKDASTIWYTKDGITWKNAPAPDLSQFPYTRSDIRSVFMVSESVAVAVGWGTFAAGLQPSIIIRSTDGGASWTQIVPPEDKRTYDNLYAVWFKDSKNGIAIGGGLKGAVALVTNDGGLTWNPIRAPIGATLYDASGIGDTIIVACSDGLIIRTPDFGRNATQTKVPGATIYSMQVIGNKIYGAGYDGILVTSRNLGKTWEAGFICPTDGYSTPNANNIYFINDLVGFSAHSYRLLAKTTDGGNTWTSLIKDTLSSTSHFYDVFFFDENTGFAVGQLQTNLDVIYKTTDGGRTWTTTSGIVNKALRAISFGSRNKGAIVGAGLKGLYTTDGGTTWQSSTFVGVPSSLSSVDLRDLAFINETTAVAVGYKIILKTTDAGKTWNYIDSTTNWLYSVSFNKNGIGYASGTGFILKSTDGGQTWTNLYDPNVIQSSTLYAVAIDTLNYAWTGGAYSFVYTNSPVTFVKLNDELPQNFTLSQNYPNPFNPSTTVEFSVPYTSRVSIKIYNALGQEIKTLINGELQPGKYKVEFNAFDLPSGVYFCVMKADGFNDMKKMLLIK
jgi:photosystem II stability/assembly factor-like uncharacterized protein